jgi:O-antigen ligase
MTPTANAPRPPAPRWVEPVEWALVAGLAVTIAWTTLCLGGYLAGTMVLSSCAVFVLAGLGALLWAAGNGAGARVNVAVLIAVPFLLYALASVWWLAPAKWLAWREWLLWFQAWLIFALALHFGRGRAQTWVLVGTLATLGVAGTAMAAYQRFIDPGWMMLGRVQAEQFAGRSAGMFGIPNSLAALLEILIPACVLLPFSRLVSPAGKIMSAWLALLFLAGLALTGSRGGWIALVMALLAWPLFSRGGWRRKGVVVAVVLAVAVVGIGSLYRHSEHARSRIDPFLQGQFEVTRPVIWKAAGQMWQEAPWLGRGAASFNVLFDQYRPRGFRDEPDWTHNDYLNTLSDYGVVGFILAMGAAGIVLWLGAGAIRRARTESSSAGFFQHWRWRAGLFLGLTAFLLHLGVDFHTKIPALSFIVALIAALLVRDEPALIRLVPRRAAWLLAVGLVVGVAASWKFSNPLYRAEALRDGARRSIDRLARTGQGDIGRILPRARAELIRAVRLDPDNGQAWSDLAYATVQTWHARGGDLVTLGRFAELAADEALKRAPVVAEFWVRKAVALDIQKGRPETESCYRRALELAPNAAPWWLYYAHHLQAFPNRRDDALEAVETCLTLDRGYPQAEALRQQLTSRR